MDIFNIKDFLDISFDYIYIFSLQYIFFISDNIFIVYPLLIILFVLLYVAYNYTTYRSNEWSKCFILAIFSPVMIFIYWIKFIYAFFERFVYYKLWWIDYMNDVPRRKRDYILERSIRESIKRKKEHIK